MSDVIARIETMYLAGGVKRCHTIPTLFTRTIAEHVYGALMVAMELYRANEDKADLSLILEVLLYHDAPEVESGDVPANVKKYSPEIDKALSAIEQQFQGTHDITGMLPADTVDRAIVEAADNIDFLFMCLHERRMGNRHPYLNVVYNRSMSYVMRHIELRGVQSLVFHIAREWGNVGKEIHDLTWFNTNR